jgi:hypothetical protein
MNILSHRYHTIVTIQLPKKQFSSAAITQKSLFSEKIMRIASSNCVFGHGFDTIPTFDRHFQTYFWSSTITRKILFSEKIMRIVSSNCNFTIVTRKMWLFGYLDVVDIGHDLIEVFC